MREEHTLTCIASFVEDQQIGDSMKYVLQYEVPTGDILGDDTDGCTEEFEAADDEEAKRLAEELWKKIELKEHCYFGSVSRLLDWRPSQ